MHSFPHAPPWLPATLPLSMQQQEGFEEHESDQLLPCSNNSVAPYCPHPSPQGSGLPALLASLPHLMPLPTPLTDSNFGGLLLLL